MTKLANAPEDMFGRDNASAIAVKAAHLPSTRRCFVRASARANQSEVSQHQREDDLESSNDIKCVCARQQESGRDGDCNRMAVVSLGTYGTQGDFSWQSSSPGALPSAHVGLERWGEHCPSIWHRSVFVE